MKNFREIELLSSYLDGHLDPAMSRQVEARLIADPELASFLSDLRATRNILKKMPARIAPRNFTLSRKMVGLKPPLPRTYSFFRFSTAFASLLLFFTLALNSLPGSSFGTGGGDPRSMAAAPLIAQAPAAQEPLAETAPMPTAEVSTLQEGAPAANLQDSAKEYEPEISEENMALLQPEPRIPRIWQAVLLVSILISGLAAGTIRYLAIRKWR